jgi:glutathione S-transferase
LPILDAEVEMKLYSGPLSLFTAKVRIALAEKGLDCELVSVPFSRKSGYSPKHPEVLRLNPKAQVPVLVDGDLSLYDSTIILEYLEDRYPDPPLLPRDPVERARCRQAEAASDEIFFPHVWALIDEVFYKPEGERDASRIATARTAIAETYRRLDAGLADREFLCRQFSVADIAYFLTTMFATNLGAGSDPSLPSFGAWLGRMAARPSVGKEIAGLTAAAANA